MSKKKLVISLAGIVIVAGIFFLLPYMGTKMENNRLLQHCNELNPQKMPECQELVQKLYPNFSATTAPLAALDAITVSAFTTPLDAKIKFYIANDPRETTRIAYCYFVQRGWFDPEQLAPERFSTAVDGFAILANETSEYVSWINTEKGQDCAELVRKRIGLPIRNLMEQIGERKAIILVNPIVGILQNKKTADIVSSIRTTLNHERVHVLQMNCSSLQLLAERLWDELSIAQKKNVAKMHPGYDWKNRTVALREHFAFLYENSLPILLSGPAAGCKWQEIK